jgi:hypothetical protein
MSHAGHGWIGTHPLETADRYCRHGGNSQGRCLPWYDQPVWIMVLTVTALGPLSLVLVWRTPRLGRTGRWMASVVIVGGTAYLGHQLWQVLRVVHRLLLSLSSSVGGRQARGSGLEAIGRDICAPMARQYPHECSPGPDDAGDRG